MEYSTESKVWFPIPTYCCDVMTTADSKEWNDQLDAAIVHTEKQLYSMFKVPPITTRICDGNVH